MDAEIVPIERVVAAEADQSPAAPSDRDACRSSVVPSPPEFVTERTRVRNLVARWDPRPAGRRLRRVYAVPRVEPDERALEAFAPGLGSSLGRGRRGEWRRRPGAFYDPRRPGVRQLIDLTLGRRGDRARLRRPRTHLPLADVSPSGSRCAPHSFASGGGRVVDDRLAVSGTACRRRGGLAALRASRRGQLPGPAPVERRPDRQPPAARRIAPTRDRPGAGEAPAGPLALAEGDHTPTPRRGWSSPRGGATPPAGRSGSEEDQEVGPDDEMPAASGRASPGARPRVRWDRDAGEGRRLQRGRRAPLANALHDSGPGQEPEGADRPEGPSVEPGGARAHADPVHAE